MRDELALAGSLKGPIPCAKHATLPCWNSPHELCVLGGTKLVLAAGSERLSLISPGVPQLATQTAVSEIANRYATALFELADEQALLDTVAEDLARLVAAIDESEDLQRLVRSPVLNREEQGKAMAAILNAMEVNDLTRRFVGLIARNRRLFALQN